MSGAGAEDADAALKGEVARALQGWFLGSSSRLSEEKPAQSWGCVLLCFCPGPLHWEGGVGGLDLHGQRSAGL